MSTAITEDEVYEALGEFTGDVMTLAEAFKMGMAKGEERGARSMLEHIVEPLKVYPDAEKQSKWAIRYIEAVMQTWRERQKK